jgi:hypothetical protein
MYITYVTLFSLIFYVIGQTYNNFINDRKNIEEILNKLNLDINNNNIIKNFNILFNIVILDIIYDERKEVILCKEDTNISFIYNKDSFILFNNVSFNNIRLLDQSNNLSYLYIKLLNYYKNINLIENNISNIKKKITINNIIKSILKEYRFNVLKFEEDYIYNYDSIINRNYKYNIIDKIKLNSNLNSIFKKWNLFKLLTESLSFQYSKISNNNKEYTYIIYNCDLFSYYENYLNILINKKFKEYDNISKDEYELNQKYNNTKLNIKDYKKSYIHYFNYNKKINITIGVLIWSILIFVCGSVYLYKNFKNSNNKKNNKLILTLIILLLSIILVIYYYIIEIKYNKKLVFANIIENTYNKINHIS